MRAVKIIGVVAFVLAFAFFILTRIGPRNYRVERSIALEASADQIFDHIKYLEKMQLWSPWTNLDPNMSLSYEGTDGTLGAICHWEGNIKVGKGSQEILYLEDLDRVDTRLTFIKPWKLEADSYVVLEEAGASNKVTWTIEGKTIFPSNIVLLFVDLDAKLGKDVENGLAKLQELVKTGEPGKKYRGYAVRQRTLSERHYGGVRKTVPIKDVSSFYTENFRKAWTALRREDPEPLPTGLYFSWSDEQGVTELAATFPIKKELNLGDDVEHFRVNAGKALEIKYYGAYDQSGQAHDALEDFMAENDLKLSYPIIEEYVTDPKVQPDTAKWLTRIIYPIE